MPQGVCAERYGKAGGGERSGNLCKVVPVPQKAMLDLGKHSIFRPALFCTVLILLIIHIQHCRISAQQHNVTKLGVFRYKVSCCSWKSSWEQNEHLFVETPHGKKELSEFFSFKHLLHLEDLY